MKTVICVKINGRFNLNIITVKIFPEEKRIEMNTDYDCEIDYNVDFDRPLTETDILVVTGKNMNIKKFACRNSRYFSTWNTSK
ncbi:MAG TPA: hypothetical protein VFC65_17555 [Prolixibacteraceae bacterium]|nr:hypothetical protein [Prolixibacteraceae bacterium]